MIDRIVICSGGRLGSWVTDHIQKDDFLIGADSGAHFLTSLRLRPNIAIGDFDSVTADQLRTIRNHSDRVITCDPIEKDYTDTEMAFRIALDMQPKEMVLLGALGSRFDHSLANVHLLTQAVKKQIRAVIIDDHNKITLATDQLSISREGYPNVSLLPLTSMVKGITLSGFKYPLRDAVLTIGQSLGISNVIIEEKGTIQVTEGQLLVIQSRD